MRNFNSGASTVKIKFGKMTVLGDQSSIVVADDAISTAAVITTPVENLQVTPHDVMNSEVFVMTVSDNHDVQTNYLIVSSK